MDYYDRLKYECANYDNFLETIKPLVTEEQYFYAESARTAYITFFELYGDRPSLSKLVKAYLRIIKNTFELFFKQYSLNKINKALILNVAFEMDSYLSKKTGIPLASLNGKWLFNTDFKKSFKIIRDYKVIFKMMNKFSDLSPKTILFIKGSIINGAQIYRDIDFSGIRILITQRDCYPREIALIRKAKESRVKTIKIDYFPIVGPYYAMSHRDCERKSVNNK